MGYALSTSLARRAWNLVVIGRGPRLEEVREELTSLGASARTISADLKDPDQIAKLGNELPEHCAELDALVNAAGVTFPDDLEFADIGPCDTMLNVNLLAPWFLSARAIPLLRRRRGIIVNIASIAASIPIPSQAIYSSTKAGLVAFGDAVREEVRSEGIRVVSVLPGSFHSEILRHMPKSYLAQHGVLESPRMQVAEVAEILCWLLEQPSSISIDEIRFTPR